MTASAVVDLNDRRRKKPLQMRCIGCGATADAACNCGEAYMPAAERADEFAKANPNASVREIVEKTGVGHGTAQRAKSRVPNGTPEITGRDGKSYPAKKHRKLSEQQPAPMEKRTLRSGLIVDEPVDCPTEAEAEEEYQTTLYDHACRIVGEMSGETRQRFFAHIRRKYRDEI
jgi:hypothetical protein